MMEKDQLIRKIMGRFPTSLEGKQSLKGFSLDELRMLATWLDDPNGLPKSVIMHGGADV